MAKPKKEIKKYFSHDSNARSDDKMLDCRLKHGWVGYALFFATIEVLREEEGYRYPLNKIPQLAYRLNCEPEILKSVILDFELFKTNKKFFFSESLIERMEIKNEKSKKASEAAKIG